MLIIQCRVLQQWLLLLHFKAVLSTHAWCDKMVIRFALMGIVLEAHLLAREDFASSP